MEKAEHGVRLRTAMAARGIGRAVVADATGKKPRTVTNWTSGETMPEPEDREILRRMFPGYDDPGDPVEVAINNSKLTDDRRHAVLSVYMRMLREQAEGTTSAG